jgi:nicotinamidase-related amidase
MTKSLFAVTAFAFGLAVAAPAPAFAGDIMQDWGMAKAPAAPDLKKVAVSAKDTALVVMDLQTNSCNAKRRPRCVGTIPKVKDLLTRARAKGMPVIYTFTSSGSFDNFIKDVNTVGGEPSVKSSVDKFYKTDLEKILKSKGVKTVILVGTAAEGAVLGTATGAAMRKFKVIVPVDGMSSTEFAEQYTAVYLTTSPGTAKATTLTRTDMIDIK